MVSNRTFALLVFIVLIGSAFAGEEGGSSSSGKDSSSSTSSHSTSTTKELTTEEMTSTSSSSSGGSQNVSVTTGMKEATTGKKEATTGMKEATTGKKEATTYAASSSSGGSSNQTVTTGKYEMTTGKKEATTYAATTGKKEVTTYADMTTGKKEATTYAASSSSGGSSNQTVTTYAATTGKAEATTGMKEATTGMKEATTYAASSSSGGSSNQTVTTYAATTGKAEATTAAFVTSASASSSSSGGSQNVSVTTGFVSSTTGQCICPTTSTSGSSSGNTSTNPQCPYFDYFSTCSGLSFSIGGVSLSFLNYDVISFGDFNANGGDVSGRLAVQGSVVIKAGYSIGDQVRASGSSPTDRSSAYSLIAGSINWVSGALYPDGSASVRENALIAGTVTVPSYLSDRFVRCNESNCLVSAFSGASSCYSALQTQLSQLSNNVEATIRNSAIQLTCTSNSSSQYVVTIDDSYFQNTTWYNLINCSPNARFIINVAGTGSVNFHGGNIPAVSENVVYNILGSGRTITVVTMVNGAILAPSNALYQTSGVIMGKVVVGSIQFALQINKPNCPALIATQTLYQNAGLIFSPSVLVLVLLSVIAML